MKLGLVRVMDRIKAQLAACRGQREKSDING
jgi:hypothetical protein